MSRLRKVLSSPKELVEAIVFSVVNEMGVGLKKKEFEKLPFDKSAYAVKPDLNFTVALKVGKRRRLFNVSWEFIHKEWASDYPQCMGENPEDIYVCEFKCPKMEDMLGSKQNMDSGV